MESQPDSPKPTTCWSLTRNCAWRGASYYWLAAKGIKGLVGRRRRTATTSRDPAGPTQTVFAWPPLPQHAHLSGGLDSDRDGEHRTCRLRSAEVKERGPVAAVAADVDAVC
jgi:hypothetical protein